MYNLSSVPRILVTLVFLGVLSLSIFSRFTSAKTTGSAGLSTSIAEIEIKGTSELESSQIMFLIESQVGNALDRKIIRRDIHAIYKMKLFEDVQVEVEELDEGESGKKSYLLRYLVKERPRLAEVKLKGVLLVERTEIEEKMTLLQYDPYDPEKIALNEQIILEHYRSEGYPRVSVNSIIETVDADAENAGERFRVIFEMNEAPRVYLTDIYVSGTKYYSELDIKRFIMSSEIDCVSWANQSGLFREEMINQDLSVITQHYLKKGYIKVFVDKPEVTLIHNPDYSRVDVRLNISEGDQYFIGKIEVSGDVLGDQEILKEDLLLEEGEIYNPFLQNRDRSGISEIYHEQGYAFVRVIPETVINEKTKIVDVTFRVVKGEKAYIGRLEIAGNVETRDHVIRREFEVQEEELFNGKKLLKSQQNINRLGFFQSGVVLERSPRDQENNMLDILARLKETQTGTFQAQLGYSDFSGFSGGVTISKGNLLGTGRTLRFSAQFAEQSVQQKFDATLIDPRLFDSQVSGSIFSSRSKLEDSTELERGIITENNYGFSLGMPLYFRDLRFSTQISALDRLFSVSDTDLFKRSVSPSLTYNTVNHPVFPSAGIKTSIRMIQTGTPFGGNIRLREYQLQYQQFWALNKDNTFILMAKGRLGLLQEQGSSPIPSEDRYRLGGIDSVRGHNYFNISGPYGSIEQRNNIAYRVITDELGYQQTKTYDSRTVGLNSSELQELKSGGISERLFNLELLFPLSQDENSFVRGVLFMDAGNVNAESRQYQLLGETEPEFFDLRKSAGFGVRVITPMGVLRFEHGSKLDKRPSETPDRFEFTVSGLF
ncbi:MAG: outer membrane protein assembly factor BamA [SAR324 cluster bacterium]|nr:outer membrane protein assembly factor BamA [SAR324 cluster bacterium]MED5482927.1 outer membrane protein assembly factor BamA [SAR324 cluster bacterium]